LASLSSPVGWTRDGGKFSLLFEFWIGNLITFWKKLSNRFLFHKGQYILPFNLHAIAPPPKDPKQTRASIARRFIVHTDNTVTHGKARNQSRHLTFVEKSCGARKRDM
jgi:hypothetical protein